jgi:hypothetical protein
VVTEGQGWLDAGESEAEARLLQPGSFALVPHGQGHRLWSEPGVPTPSVLELEREQVSDCYEILRHGQGEKQTTMICGALSCNHPAACNLIDALPKIIVIDALHSPQMEWMQSELRLMAAESRERRPGGEAVSAVIMERDIFFVLQNKRLELHPSIKHNSKNYRYWCHRKNSRSNSYPV